MALLDKLEFTSGNDSESDTEIGYEFQQDPEPGDQPARKTKATRGRAPAPTTKTAIAKVAKQVAEDLATVIEVSAAIWGMSDDCCAPTLEQQAKPIADALVGILSRNPRVLMALAGSDIAVIGVQTIALGRAIGPVGKAVYRNHISKATTDDEEHAHDHGTVQLGAFPAFSGIPRTVAA